MNAMGLFFCLPEHSIHLNHLTTWKTLLYMKSDRQRWSTSPRGKNDVIKHGHGKLPLQLAKGLILAIPYHLTIHQSCRFTFRVRVEIVLCIASKKTAANSSKEKGAFPRPDTSRKINIEPENDAFGNTLFLFQGYILRFHINLPGCTCEKKHMTCFMQTIGATLPVVV